MCWAEGSRVAKIDLGRIFYPLCDQTHEICGLAAVIVPPFIDLQALPAVTRIDIQQAADEHFSRVHRAALVLTGNPWDADDLAQETFLVAARQQHKFEGRSSLYTWLYGILLNLDRRERRRIGTHYRKLKLLSLRDPSSTTSTPPADSPVVAAEWKSSLWSYVAQLPDGQQKVLVLRFSEYLRYDEIAEVLQCPLGTVKSRIFHGLAALKTMLADDKEVRQLPPFPAEDIHHAI